MLENYHRALGGFHFKWEKSGTKRFFRWIGVGRAETDVQRPETPENRKLIFYKTGSFFPALGHFYQESGLFWNHKSEIHRGIAWLLF